MTDADCGQNGEYGLLLNAGRRSRKFPEIGSAGHYFYSNLPGRANKRGSCFALRPAKWSAIPVLLDRSCCSLPRETCYAIAIWAARRVARSRLQFQGCCYASSAKGNHVCRQTGEELAGPSGGTVHPVPVLRPFLRNCAAGCDSGLSLRRFFPPLGARHYG